MSTDPKFISISERAYTYIRQFTIKSISDALVELITNSIDAYNLTTYPERLIEIDMIGVDIIKVRDKAKGLTATEMESCFLQIGNYTANETSRGFFSRGAKDISAIGNIIFDSVKDGKYSRCLLGTDAYGAVAIKDIDITDEIRNTVGIEDPMNGLVVTIELLPNFQNPNLSNLQRDLKNLAILRDIMNNTSNIINFRVFDNDRNIILENRLSYTFPVGENYLDLQFSVPNYSNYTARLVINKSDKPIEQPVSENQMQFGFLIKSNTTIFEVSVLDSKYRWNPYINYLYGYLLCDGISKLLLDYDKNGSTIDNPYPIIDPSRVTGINYSHPFIKSLLQIPLLRVDYILRQLNTSVSSSMINITDLNDLIDELGKLGLNIMDSNDIKVNYSTSYDEDLISAIKDDRANYVMVEKSYVMNTKFTTSYQQTIDYVQGKIKQLSNTENNQNLQNSLFLIAKSGELVKIPKFSINGSISNIPQHIIDLIISNNSTDLSVNPYIYKLSDDGSVEQLYIFNKGCLSSELPDDNAVIIKNKLFSIQFINDLNKQNRFYLDYTNGITIQVNLNNPIVKKYLTANNDSTDITLSSFTSTQSLLFFKELFIDASTQLVLDNDTMNGKLILDGSSSFNNSKRVIDYKNQLSNTIELSVDKVFDKFINDNINSKINILSEQINTIGSNVASIMGNTPELAQLVALKENLLNLVSLHME